MTLQSSCTFARCHCVEWGREQSDGDSFGGMVQEQGGLRSWRSCVSILCVLAVGAFQLYLQNKWCWSRFVPVVVVVAYEFGDLTEGLVHDNVAEQHGG